MRFALLLLAMVLLLTKAESRADSVSAQAQYDSLLREYQRSSVGLRRAETDQQRKAAVDRCSEFPERFLQLANDHSSNPIALVALRQAIQIVNSADSAGLIAWETNQSHFPVRTHDTSATVIVERLTSDYLRSDQLAPVIDRMRYGYRPEYDRFLSDVLRLNPNRTIQAQACLALAQFLHDRRRMIYLANDRPALRSHYQAVFGEGYLETWQDAGVSILDARIENLLQQAMGDYADVETLQGDLVGERARMEWHEIQHLSVGRVAPDIVGQDQDGETFRLSDYRGRVVLLYFWVEL